MAPPLPALPVSGARDYRAVFGQDVALEYDRITTKSPYAAAIWQLEKEILDAIVSSKRAATPHLRYLDFACGTGRIISHLEATVDEAVGVDVSKPMLEIAERNVRRSRLVHADITDGTGTDLGSFDVITAFRFFPRCQDPLRKQAIRALRNLLNDSGILVFNNHLRSESLGHRLRTSVVDRLRCVERETMDDKAISDLLAAGQLRILAQFHIGVVPSAHGWLPLPFALYVKLEGLLMKPAWARPYAQHHIYICGKA